MSDQIVLKSSEGDSIPISKKAAKHSVTIKDVMEGNKYFLNSFLSILFYPFFFFMTM